MATCFTVKLFCASDYYLFTIKNGSGLLARNTMSTVKAAYSRTPFRSKFFACDIVTFNSFFDQPCYVLFVGVFEFEIL